MSTYKQILYHIIFATKNRRPTITEEHCEELYKYISGIIQNKNGHLYRINGIEDHIHILSDLHPSLTLAGFIKDIKVASSQWLKENTHFPYFSGWQIGYGAFTVSNRGKDAVINYIKRQKEHHKKEPFYDEYKRILIEHDIPFEDKYLL